MLLKLAFVVVMCACVFGQEGHDPGFLLGEPKEVVDSFHQLLANNHEHTDAQIEAKVQEWLKKQTPELRAKHDKFVEENKKFEKQAEEAHARSVAKLSPEAKKADEELWSISHSETLTNKEKEEKIKKIIDSLPANVHEEINREQNGTLRRKRQWGRWGGGRGWGYGGGWNRGWGGGSWGYRPWGWGGYGWGK